MTALKVLRAEKSQKAPAA